MKIERIRIKNFKALQDVTLNDVEPFTVFVGENGVGKSTLFDVFGFLRDCLKDNVRPAVNKRGGFRELVTRGHEGESIEIEISLRMRLGGANRRVIYELHVGETAAGVLVRREVFKHTRGTRGRAFEFLNFRDGVGTAVENEAGVWRDESPIRSADQTLDSPDILALKGLGQFQRFEAASAFRNLIENWHVSDFHISSARTSQDEGFAEHLSTQGENLPLVTQYLYESHRSVFEHVLRKMAARVPGVESVQAEKTIDGRIVLRFKDGSFKDPFVSRYVSDGTIKMFAYLVLLNDPKPHPLLCVEEPENQLYPTLLEVLAEEFIEYARKGGQVFVSTHSPDFLDGAPLKSIFILSKNGGVTTVSRAADDINLRNLVADGDKPGLLWRQRLLGRPSSP